jgi:hypothetical protein
MTLTEENKKYIDSLTYAQLLEKWRFSPPGDLWFQDETGAYWGRRLANLRDEDPDNAVQASKDLGWSR